MSKKNRKDHGKALTPVPAEEVKSEAVNTETPKTEVVKSEAPVVKAEEKKVATPADKPARDALASTTNDDETEVTFNLQPYLIPIALILNALIIAVAIFIVGRNGFGGNGSNANVAGITNTPAATAAQEQNPAAKTSIADSPVLGDKTKAKIAIVEYSDYECPFCKRHHQQVQADIVKNYVDTGKAIYVYRNYIAVPSHNPAATTEAYAAMCVRELAGNSDAKYFEYGDLLYTNTGSNGTGLQNSETVYTLAGKLGINQDSLKTCIDSAKYKDIVSRDEQAAQQAGVQGTPGFVVGVLAQDGTVDGKIIAGAYPFSEFQKVADEMLAKAQ